MKTERNRIKFIIIFILICFGKLYSQEQLTNLPTLYITTDGGQLVTDTENYKKGRIIVKSSVPSEELNMITEIRGRGNSTWGMPKKPYRIKLDSKTQLLNLPAKAKNWVLLANYADKTLIRNALAFKISEMVELEFSPSVRFVDVVLNDEYLGNYMVTDQVQVHSKRVPVEEQEGAEDIAGGYLIEVDGFASSEPNWFTTRRGIPVTVKYPDDEDINAQQNAYIREFTQRFEDVLFSSNFKDPETGYRSMVDERSLINWYIACELTGNSDAFWSIYMYKYRDSDKFYFGPLWDFDIAFNNDNRLGDATTKLMRTSAHDPKIWIRRIWEDQWFRNAVNTRWIELIDEKRMEEVLLNYIVGLEEELYDSQKMNFNKWKVLSQRVYNEVYLFPTYEQGVDYLLQYMSDRISFLTDSFESTVGKEPEVFDPGDSYYAFLNSVNGKAITVANNSILSNTKLVLWDLDESNNSHLWKFVSLENGSYQIVNLKSNRVIARKETDQDLIQTISNKNDENQHWTIIPLEFNNLYGFVNNSSHFAIDNSGGSSSNGNSIIEWDNQIYNNQNQQWYIKMVVDKTNITDLTDESQLTIYPNPVSASGTLNIRLAGQALMSGKDLSLEIYTLEGKLIYKENKSSDNNRIELDMASAHVSPGLYILRIENYYAKLMIK